MSHLLIQADARRIPLANGSVHCVVTSPPYWGLRDYGVDGQIGLEATPDEFVASMVAVFREVWRVLRPDGTCWLNLGTTYNAYNGGAGPYSSMSQGAQTTERPKLATGFGLNCKNLKPKDLIGIPWMVAFALQADGWYLRSDIIWVKPNPMPESVTDRPTKSHEYLFLLAKQERYYFDQEAVREEGSRYGWNAPQFKCGDITRHHGSAAGGGGSPIDPNAGRNLRSVWTIATESYAGAHFATFPRKLVEPCIKAGTSERGTCPTCGAPWERVTDGVKYQPEVVAAGKRFVDASRGDKVRKLNGKSPEWVNATTSRSTLGWRPTCAHDAAPVPCRVFDPFMGSGTTLVVAEALGRVGIGCDLSSDYLAQARRRIERPHQPLTKQREPDHPLFAHMEDA